ncbi:MAG: hypothetical protein ACYDAE_29105 [Steroidobacteraceae bacterium]
MSAYAEMARKPPRSFVMHGEPYVAGQRATSVDPPDVRVPEVQVRKLSPEQVRVLTRAGQHAIDPRFRGVDRFFERWASSYALTSPPPSMGYAQADLIGTPRDAVMPLAADDLTVVDMIVLHSPEWAKRFVFMRYRLGYSTAELAAEIKCRLRGVFDEQRVVLAYFLGRLTEAGVNVPSWEPDV